MANKSDNAHEKVESTAPEATNEPQAISETVQSRIHRTLKEVPCGAVIAQILDYSGKSAVIDLDGRTFELFEKGGTWYIFDKTLTFNGSDHTDEDPEELEELTTVTCYKKDKQGNKIPGTEEDIIVDKRTLANFPKKIEEMLAYAERIGNKELLEKAQEAKRFQIAHPDFKFLYIANFYQDFDKDLEGLVLCRELGEMQNQEPAGQSGRDEKFAERQQRKAAALRDLLREKIGAGTRVFLTDYWRTGEFETL